MITSVMDTSSTISFAVIGSVFSSLIRKRRFDPGNVTGVCCLRESRRLKSLPCIEFYILSLRVTCMVPVPLLDPVTLSFFRWTLKMEGFEIVLTPSVEWMAIRISRWWKFAPSLVHRSHSFRCSQRFCCFCDVVDS